MEMAQFRCLLDRRFIERRAFLPTALVEQLNDSRPLGLIFFASKVQLELLKTTLTSASEYLDDFVLHDSRWPILVAIVAMCLDWVYYRWSFCLPNWPNRRDLPYPICGSESCILRNLGFFLADPQSCVDGGYMVWRPGKLLCACYDSEHYTKQKSPK
jgi:hypothetical protein